MFHRTNPVILTFTESNHKLSENAYSDVHKLSKCYDVGFLRKEKYVLGVSAISKLQLSLYD